MYTKNKTKLFSYIKIALPIFVFFCVTALLIPVRTLISIEANASYGVLKQGNGSLFSPYIIRTADDLVNFSKDVNEGNTYKGKYVKQIENIDLSGIDFVPIGIFGGGNYFEGTYFGGGHILSNLTVSGKHGESENNGLFGLLEGTVYSLGIESGNIDGNCVGSIASHTSGDGATIVNCYSKAYLHGSRAGGIADNFSGGKIINCWSLSYNDDGYIPLCSYAASLIESCYSAGEIIGDDAKQYGKLIDNSSHALDFISDSSFYETLNETNKYVYKHELLKNGIENYTYTNEKTSFISNNETKDVYLEGKGTKYSPYKINDAFDMVAFSRSVEDGNEYKNKYVKQTNDIDMNGFSFTPIGVFGEGYYFFGTYDGSGYRLYNMTIDCDRGGRNNGLFGALGGKVMNLGIEDSYIEGNCCGSFASHSASYDAMIINCYSTAQILGARSGGIADNFLGYILGCWYHSDKESLPIVSYDALLVKYCYNNYKDTLPNTFEGEQAANFNLPEEAFSEDTFINSVNSNLAFVAADSGTSLASLTKCGTNIYTNAFENWFIYPSAMRQAYKYFILAYIAIIVSILILFFTLRNQINKRRKDD